MDNLLRNQALKWMHSACAVALFCLVSGASLAQDSAVSAARLISDGDQSVSHDEDFRPLPLMSEQTAGLPFDVAGSDTRKLQLQLAQPLNFQATTNANWLNSGGGSLIAGTSLQWMAVSNLGFGASVEQGKSQVQFQPVGSIHCQNGILDASSYRASDCYFTNETNDLNFGTVSIGADYSFGNSSNAAISLFRQESSFDSRQVAGLAGAGASPILGTSLRAPLLAGTTMPPYSGGPALSYLDTEVTGIDLEFKLGVSTGSAGDMQIGLQFSHILDGEYQSQYLARDSFTNWTVAEPFDSAKVSFAWQKNSFSGGFEGFYREPIEFIDGSDLDSVTTFDVHFTWRAPWNASLSVGASNLLNSGVDESSTNENTINDPFEAVYGRIPYVRYQQDL